MKRMPGEYRGSDLKKIFELFEFAAMDELTQEEYLARFMFETDQKSFLRTVHNKGFAGGDSVPFLTISFNRRLSQPDRPPWNPGADGACFLPIGLIYRRMGDISGFSLPLDDSRRRNLEKRAPVPAR